MEIPKEEIERVRENLKRTNEYNRKFKELPEVKEQAKIFLNYMAHCGLLNVLGSARCPSCGKGYENLVWKCCGLSVEDAQELLTEKVPKHAEEVKKARERIGLKLNLIPYKRKNGE